MSGDGMSAGTWVMVAILSALGLVCCVIPGALMIIGMLSDAMSR